MRKAVRAALSTARTARTPGPLARYGQLVTKGRLRRDAAQVAVLEHLGRLHRVLAREREARDADAAARAVQKRVAGFKKAYGEAYSGLMRAWRLGVTKVPAVVVDGTYVVYGQPDVTAAVAEIRRAETREK